MMTLPKIKVTPFTLLNAIRLQETIKLIDLGEPMVMDRTTPTHNLSALERQGMVQSQGSITASQRSL